MRRVSEWVGAAPLSVLGLVAVYAAIAAGEFVAGSLVSHALGDTGLHTTAARLVIHTFITLPVAFAVGYGLVRWNQVSGFGAMVVVALLWSILIVVFQLFVYEPSVVGASILKVSFVVVPLYVGGSVAQRVSAHAA